MFEFSPKRKLANHSKATIDIPNTKITPVVRENLDLFLPSSEDLSDYDGGHGVDQFYSSNRLHPVTIKQILKEAKRRFTRRRV